MTTILALRQLCCLITHLSGIFDIGSNFYMDREGRVYEGRGYNYKAAFKTGLVGGDPFGNHLSITVFGDYRTQIPPPEVFARMRAFCACAVENGMLYSN